MKEIQIVSKKIRDITPVILNFLAGIAVVCWIIAKWENDEEIIIRLLAEKGYSTEHLELIKVEGQRNLYRASEEIDIGDGEMVGYWKINSTYVGKMYGGSYIVQPHPRGEWPEKVSLTLSFSLKEYEHLEELADGKDIKKYLKEVLRSKAGIKCHKITQISP